MLSVLYIHKYTLLHETIYFVLSGMLRFVHTGYGALRCGVCRTNQIHEIQWECSRRTCYCATCCVVFAAYRTRRTATQRIRCERTLRVRPHTTESCNRENPTAYVSWMVAKWPPPMPVLCAFTTPTQNMLAMAASTADPPRSRRIFLHTHTHTHHDGIRFPLNAGLHRHVTQRPHEIGKKAKNVYSNSMNSAKLSQMQETTRRDGLWRRTPLP